MAQLLCSKKDLGGAFKMCANTCMWAVSESAMPQQTLWKELRVLVSLLVSSVNKQIISQAKCCWGPDIHTECIFFCLWASSSLLPWTGSPFGSAVHIAHLLTELQGWSTGALGGWFKSPFQIHTWAAMQEFPLEHKDGSVTCVGAWGQYGGGW